MGNSQSHSVFLDTQWKLSDTVFPKKKLAFTSQFLACLQVKHFPKKKNPKVLSNNCGVSKYLLCARHYPESFTCVRQSDCSAMKQKLLNLVHRWEG